MTTPQASAEYYRSQQALTVATIAAARSAWTGMRPDFDLSWPAVSRRLLLILVAAQLRAARDADGYVTRVLDELGIPARAVARLNPRAFMGTASDGRALESLLYWAVIRAKQAEAQTQQAGQAPSAAAALAVGQQWLAMMLQTQVADIGRAAVAASMTTRPAVSGYVRMLNPPSCSRCVILAGRWYRRNEGFERHPGCDCRHIPATENMAGDLRTDPRLYFDSLTEAQQDKIFTNAGAEAIRLGADIGQVVNARRGMHTAQVNDRGWIPKGRLAPVRIGGRDVFVSTEGTTKAGLASRARTGRSMKARLMPESILQIAGDDRAEALRLLRLHGYIL